MKGNQEVKEKVRVTKCQQEKLVEIMERNPELAKGTGSNPTQFWKDVALELNSMGPAVKDGVGWKRTWIEKKSLVKKKLSQNKKEVHKTGGGKPTFIVLNELEERIAVVTNVRDVTERMESALCIGMQNPAGEGQQSPSNHSQTTEQQGASHHSRTTEHDESPHQIQTTEQQPESSHHLEIQIPQQPEPSSSQQQVQSQSNQISQQPSPLHHNQTTELPGPSHHSQTSDAVTLQKSHAGPALPDNRTKKTPAQKLEEFQTKILEQNDKTNEHLAEISQNLKILAEGTLGIYQEIFKFMQNSNKD